MNDPTRDPLDQAIDRVAARLVSVDHDEPFDSPIGRASRPLAGLAQDRAIVERIVARLPERSAGGWLPVLMPQAAREVPAAPAPSGAVAAPPTAIRVAAPRVTETASVALADHERSLAPVAALIPLEVVSLASPALLEEAPVVLAPIVLNDLPLSGEPNSPR